MSVYTGNEKVFFSIFDMKDLGEASFVLGIEIHRDRSKRVLGLSQKAYIEKVLKKFSMLKCSPLPAPIVRAIHMGIFNAPRTSMSSIK
jgi:hypothetical protein